jgi:hypothetical protein
MAEEDHIEQGNDGHGRTGTGEMTSGMRLDAGKVMEVVRSPGDRWRVADVELLRRLMAVKVEGNEPEKEDEREGVGEMRIFTMNV